MDYLHLNITSTMKTPYIETKRDKDWYNWHRTRKVGGEVDKILTPFNRYTDNSKPPVGKEFLPGLQGLQMIISNAEQEEARVRAHGSRWSLNNVAYTTDHLVDSRQLGFYKVGITEDVFVTDAYKEKMENLSFFQCGVMVRAVNQALQAKKQALSTSGASDGQTLVGAISTGTHGAANQVGAMTEFVRGIHLVISGKHVFVQRASDQAITHQFCDWLDHAEYVADDNLFNAALVGFGCFGLIHGLLIESEAIYMLELVIKRYDASDVMKAITTLNVDGLDLPGGNVLPYHFEVGLNPYKMKKGEEGASVRVYYKRSYDDTVSGLESAQEEYHDIHTAMGMTFDEDAARKLEEAPEESELEGVVLSRKDRIGALIQIALKKSYKLTDPDKPDIRIPGQFFTGKNSAKLTSEAPVAGTSIELGVPIDNIEDGLDYIIKALNDNPFAAPLALRFVKQSTATLGFTGLGKITVALELPEPWGKWPIFPQTGKKHQKFFRAMAESDIPHSFHWGQQLPKNINWISKTYGAKLKMWKEQRIKFLGDAGIKMFSNEFVDSFLGDSGIPSA